MRLAILLKVLLVAIFARWIELVIAGIKQHLSISVLNGRADGYTCVDKVVGETLPCFLLGHVD